MIEKHTYMRSQSGPVEMENESEPPPIFSRRSAVQEHAGLSSDSPRQQALKGGEYLAHAMREVAGAVKQGAAGAARGAREAVAATGDMLVSVKGAVAASTESAMGATREAAAWATGERARPAEWVEHKPSWHPGRWAVLW
jgi:hypothetical protein